MPSENLSQRYNSRRPLLEQLAQNLEQKTASALEEFDHIDRIAFRTKTEKSFLTKAQKLDDGIPKYSNPFAELEDQVAGRVIVFFREDLDTTRTKLEEWFGSVEHEIKEPASLAEFDYESDHLVFVINEHDKPAGWQDFDEMPSTFEMQIRTLFMHAWAEPQHDLAYKASPDHALDDESRRELAWVAASAWGADRTLSQVASRLGVFE